MLTLAVRFLIGGTIVALVPYLAHHVGPRAAALVMLVPALTLTSLVSLGISQGGDAVRQTALAGLPGLATVALFLGSLALAVRIGTPLPLAFVTALLAWAGSAAVLLAVTGGAAA